MSALKLTGQEVPQPSLKQRDNTAEEKDPHAPPGRPEADAGSFADGSGIEPVVNQVLEVLAHPDLAHQTVLIPIHPRQLSHMGERILEAVCQLECVNVAESVLDVRIYNQLGEAEDFTGQVERISEATDVIE